MHHENSPEALKSLQDGLYRERILRARAMTPDERLADVFSLSNFTFSLMLDGALEKLATSDEEAGWELVERQLQRLAGVPDSPLYRKQPASEAA